MSEFHKVLLKEWAYLVEQDSQVPLSTDSQQAQSTGPGNDGPLTGPMPGDANAPTDKEKALKDQQPEQETPEGQMMLIDLIKKALFIDPKEITMSPTDKGLLVQQVTPKNALKMAETLERIVGDYESPNIPVTKAT